MRDVLESNYSIRVLRSTYLDGTLVIPIHREENNPIAKTPRHRWIVQCPKQQGLIYVVFHRERVVHAAIRPDSALL